MALEDKYFSAEQLDVAALGSVGGANIQFNALFNELAADNIVAHSGGGQASATVLTTQTNRVITVAASGDSVVLPGSAPGLEVTVINHGANPMQVYGLGSDQID